MSWRITYTNKHTGNKAVHQHSHTEGDARGWTESLASEHGCKAVCEHVADGPYDNSGKVTHVVSKGNDK